MGEKRIRKITFIPQLKKLSPQNHRNVAAYARVSTDSDEQETSLEAQRDYYEKLIKANAGWNFIGVYYDDGISGLSYKNRDGFNRLISDALNGKIDLILTKSLSRFARNTVDALTIIRKLKERGIEVYFEKEDIHTLDSKGEFLITLMSSLAQEESRSISENVTWGRRKQFADGKYSVAYSSFLGYKQDGKFSMVIDDEEAIIVRLIYLLFLEGWTAIRISAYLTEQGIPPPMKGERWHQATVDSILQNEKYHGDALLQKKYTIDYLSKKSKKNEGEVPQYYLENVHPAIITKKIADLTAMERQRRRKEGYYYSSVHPWASLVICEHCGGFYGLKQLHRSGVFYGFYWRCNGLYRNNCHSMIIYDETLNLYAKIVIKELFSKYADVLGLCASLINEIIVDEVEPISAEKLSAMLFDNLETFNLDFSSIRCLVKEVLPKTGESITFLISDDTEMVFEAKKTGKELLKEVQKVIRKEYSGIVEELDDISESTVSVPKKNYGMSEEVKESIREMRRGGANFEQIGEELEISPATARRYCYRHCANLSGPGSIPKPNIKLTDNLDNKSKVLILRLGGYSYKRIAKITGINDSSIKDYCYRAGLGGVRAGIGVSEGRCRWCGTEVEQTPNKRKKEYCSDACRQALWKSIQKAKQLEEMLLKEKTESPH